MPKRKQPRRTYSVDDPATITIELSAAEVIAVARFHESEIRRLPTAVGKAMRENPKATARDLKLLQDVFREQLKFHANRASGLYSLIPD